MLEHRKIKLPWLMTGIRTTDLSIAGCLDSWLAFDPQIFRLPVRTALPIELSRFPDSLWVFYTIFSDLHFAPKHFPSLQTSSVDSKQNNLNLYLKNLWSRSISANQPIICSRTFTKKMTNNYVSGSYPLIPEKFCDHWLIIVLILTHTAVSTSSTGTDVI
jgi:hypothetical protein